VTRRTIETVLQSAARTEFDTLDLLRGKHGVEPQTEKIPPKRGNDGLDVDQMGESSPIDISLEAFKTESRGMEERWSWTAGDIVAEEGERVANERQQDRESGDDDSGVSLAYIYTESVTF